MDFFATLTALFHLVSGTLPSDEERLKRLELHAPLIMERVKRKILNQRLAQLTKLNRFLSRHNIPPDRIVQYVHGDTTEVAILKEMQAGIKK